MKIQKKRSAKPNLISVSALWKSNEPIGFKAVLRKKDFNADIDFEGMISSLIKSQEKKYSETPRQEYLDKAVKAMVYVAKGIKQKDIPKLQLVEILLTAISEIHVLEKHGHIQSDENNGVNYFSDHGNYDPLTYNEKSKWSSKIQSFITHDHK